MPTAEVTRRAILFLAATAVLTAALFYDAGGPATLTDTLPAQLSDKEFWRMVTDFSESGGYFRSDNFLSNESGYQHVIPTLRKTIRSGGAYLGVGPEQNFTYIVGLEPKIAFIVDIRRQNMLEHLLYKSLMELCDDRAEFLSRLFARPRPEFVNAGSSPEDLVRGYREVQASSELFEASLRLVLDHLERTKGFELSYEDEARVRYVYQAFFESGPDLSYTFLGGYNGFTGPTYGELMTEDDGHARNWHFLASEDQYRKIQRLQKNNLIVPLVGDFAGPMAVRSVARYLKEHNAVLSVFYTSNVEQYLFQNEEAWNRFYANVSALPVDGSSLFIRYVLNGRRINRRDSLLSPIRNVTRAYIDGRIRSYYDVIDLSW